ncbi:MAG TPA: hypothetical protein VMZ92_14610 [Planctomycetota bacterium]|nr:hypothetical protein [Planctomycetota bacterium]
MIEMKCPRCGTRLKFEDAAAGTTVPCTICTVAIELPAAEAPPPEAPPPAPGAPADLEASAPEPVDETPPVPDDAPADTYDIEEGPQPAGAFADEMTSPEAEEVTLLTVRPSFWASRFLGRVAPLGCVVSLVAGLASLQDGEVATGAFLLALCVVCLGVTLAWVGHCTTRRLILTTHRTTLETGVGTNKRTLQVRNADIIYVNADHQRRRWGRENRGTLTVATRILKLEIGPINRLAYVAAAIRGAAHRAGTREEAGEAWESSTD